MGREYKDETPMTRLVQRHVSDNVNAFSSVLERNLPKRLDLIVEGMGGTGNQTKRLQELFSCRDHRVWDLSEECCRILLEIPKIKVYQEDFFKAEIIPRGESLLCLDYNCFTASPRNWKKIKPVFEIGFKWLVATDLARGKLHLNYRTYSMASPDYGDYLDFFAGLGETVGYDLIDHEKAPRSITYVLWRRR